MTQQPTEHILSLHLSALTQTLLVHSELLAEDVLLVPAGYHATVGEPVTYTAPELRAIVEAVESGIWTPEDLLAAHRVKRAMPGATIGVVRSLAAHTRVRLDEGQQYMARERLRCAEVAHQEAQQLHERVRGELSLERLQAAQARLDAAQTACGGITERGVTDGPDRPRV